MKGRENYIRREGVWKRRELKEERMDCPKGKEGNCGSRSWPHQHRGLSYSRLELEPLLCVAVPK